MSYRGSILCVFILLILIAGIGPLFCQQNEDQGTVEELADEEIKIPAARIDTRLEDAAQLDEEGRPVVMKEGESFEGRGSFGIGDWAIVILYLLAMVFVGLWMSRGQKSTRDYFLGGRNIPWWAVGMAIIATETSAMTFIGIPALAFGGMVRNEAGQVVLNQGSIGFLQIVIGYVIARVIVAIIMVPHYFKGDVYSPYQILLKYFGKTPRYLASGIFLIQGAMGAGVRIYVTAIPVMIVFRVFFPAWGILHSIILFTVVSVIYTYIGGIKAVVWTDVIQFCIFVIGGLFAVFYVPSLLSGGWSEVWSIAGDSGRLDPIDMGTVGWAEAQGMGYETFWGFIWANIKEIFKGSSESGGIFNIWMGLIGATIGVMCSHGVDQLNVQRVLTCRNAKEGGKALILSAILILPLFFLFLMVGIALYAFYKTNGFNFGVNPWTPHLNNAPKTDYVFPIFIITHVPPLLKGLLVAGILSAAMSSISGALSALGSVSVMDIYRVLDKNRKSEKTYLKLSRFAVIVVAVVLIIIAFLSQYATLVFNLAFTLVGITSGALLGSILFAMWYGRANPWPIVAGMVSSVIGTAVIVILVRSGVLVISWPWFTPFGTAICLGVAYVMSFFFEKPGKDYEDDMKPIAPTH